MSDVEVGFGANINDLVGKMGQAGKSVEDSVGGMSKAIGTLTGVFDGFFGKLTQAIGILAGGAAFKSFIDSTNEMNAESSRLATTLGITGERASILRVAISDVRLTTDEYLGTMQRFQRQLRSNEQALIDNGIKTRDANGHLRENETLLAETLAKINEYKQGVDRNTKAMELMGSRVGDVNKLMKLTPEVIEEARKKAESLNLIMSEESKKASRDYKAAMNDVQDVTEGVSKTIGEAFLPLQTKGLVLLAELGPQIVQATRIMIDAFFVTKESLLRIFEQIGNGLTDLVQKINAQLQIFTNDGPNALQIFANSLRILPALITGFQIAFESLVNVIVSGVIAASVYWAGLAEGMAKFFNRDFSGAVTAIRSGLQSYASEIKAGMDRAKAILAKGKQDLDDILTKPLGVAPKVTPAGRDDKGGTRVNDDMKQQAAALARASASEEAARSAADLALFKEQLKEREEALKNSYKNNLVEIKTFYSASLKITLEGIDAEIAAQKRKAEAARKAMELETDPVKRKAANAQYIAELGQVAVLEEKRKNAFTASAREMENAEEGLRRKLTATRQEMEAQLALKSVDNEEAQIRHRRTLLEIDAQEEIRLLMETEQKKYEIRKQAIQQQRLNGNLSREQLAALLKEEEILEADHVNKVAELYRQMEEDRRKYAIEAQNAIESSLSTFLQNLGNKSKSVRDSWLSMLNSIQAAITKMMADQAVQKLMGMAGGSIGSSFAGALANIGAAYFGGGEGGGVIGTFQGRTPGRADGGPVTAGQPYFVGERGPELFIPKASGTIAPNGSTGGSVVVRNTFHLGAATDARTQQQIAALTGRAVNNALKRNT